MIENKLDKLKFARSKSAYCYFSAAATFFAPELSDARMAWAKNGVLTTVVDDFFDVGGSLEELNNLIQLVELYFPIPTPLAPLSCGDLEVTIYRGSGCRWDVDVSTECSSYNVQIIFSALRSTICEIGDKGFKLQGRSITNHINGIVRSFNSLISFFYYYFYLLLFKCVLYLRFAPSVVRFATFYDERN